jgi:Ca2+/H+ antiporter
MNTPSIKVPSAALALALEEQAVGAAALVARRMYGQVMAICEGLVGLALLRPTWRTSG